MRFFWGTRKIAVIVSSRNPDPTHSLGENPQREEAHSETFGFIEQGECALRPRCHRYACVRIDLLRVTPLRFNFGLLRHDPWYNGISTCVHCMHRTLHDGAVCNRTAPDHSSAERSAAAGA